MVILPLAQPDCGHAQTVEACIDVGECRGEVLERGEVRVHDLADLWVADVDRMARNKEYVFDARIVEAFKEYSLANHAGRTKDDGIHIRMLV